MYENSIGEVGTPSTTDTNRYIDELLKEADKLITEYEHESPNNCLQNKNLCEYDSSESETEREFMELKKLGKCVGDFGGRY